MKNECIQVAHTVHSLSGKPKAKNYKYERPITVQIQESIKKTHHNRKKTNKVKFETKTT